MAWKAKPSGMPDVPDKGAVCAAYVDMDEEELSIRGTEMRKNQKKREKKRGTINWISGWYSPVYVTGQLGGRLWVMIYD